MRLKKGYYLFELWGCSSTGYQDSDTYLQPSRGSFVSGYILLKKTNDFYVHVCSKGQYYMYKNSYGGGGQGQFGGGGSSDVRLLSGEYDDFESLKSRIIVAAGAGGSDSKDQGGPGGSLKGYNSTQNKGKGGTQTFGGIGIENGKFGKGGGENRTIGLEQYHLGTSGGGSGYFGGGTSDDYGSGGGSCYISGHEGCVSVIKESKMDNISFKTQGDISIHYSGFKFERTVIVDGKHEMKSPNGTFEIGHLGNGFVRITTIFDISEILWTCE